MEQARPRTIVHMDMDSFFASVEMLDNPEYRGKPLIVGGRRDSPRGVVATCSYEARKYGVRSGMPLSEAARLCPHGIFIPGRHKRYAEVSRKIMAVLEEFTPVIEQVSVDEAFLDMTGCEHFYADAREMGQKIKARIREAVSLTCSVGIAPNKFLAKVASDLQKPDGLVIVRPEEVDAFLEPLPVRKIWGVGERAEQELLRLGIHTVRDLKRWKLDDLVARFGAYGSHLYMLARGIDDRPVGEESETKSISRETTFDYDVGDFEALRRTISELSASVGARLRAAGLFARTVHIKLRYPDFTTITRAHTLPVTFCDDDTIYEEAMRLFTEANATPHKYRLVGVGVAGLSAVRQQALFTDGRREEISKVMDRINAKFQGRGIVKGRNLNLGDRRRKTEGNRGSSDEDSPIR